MEQGRKRRWEEVKFPAPGALSGRALQTSIRLYSPAQPTDTDPKGCSETEAHRRVKNSIRSRKAGPHRDLAGPRHPRSFYTLLLWPFPCTIAQSHCLKPYVECQNRGPELSPHVGKPGWDPPGKPTCVWVRPLWPCISTQGMHTKASFRAQAGNSTNESWLHRTFSGPPWEPTKGLQQEWGQLHNSSVKRWSQGFWRSFWSIHEMTDVQVMQLTKCQRNTSECGF